MNIELVVIPEPPEGSRAVLVSDSHRPHPLATGTGEVNCLCGACGFTLCEGLESAGQVAGVVLRCPRCTTYNETRT